jgi:folate-binding Fe-S cluster repair protein YgfZ
LLEHAWFSETRLFMALIMGGGMVLVMLLYMLHMYRSTSKNLIAIACGVLLIGVGVGLVRSQVTVTDTDYMEGMIPHHSIAILTSERARIDDPRVRELADEIIKAQRREIKEMEWLIADIRENGIAETQAEADERAVPKFEGTLE